MRNLALLFALLFAAPLFSQEGGSGSKRAIRQFERGREYFQQRLDKEAEVYLQKAVEIDPSFADAWFMLAQISLDRNQTAEAAAFFLAGVETDPDEYAGRYLKVAELEYASGQYREASLHLEKWRSYHISDSKSQAVSHKLAANIAFSIHAVSNPVPFHPESLGDSVNTDQFEYWPTLSVDEKMLFFTALVPPNPELPPERLELQEDFYFARKVGDQWHLRQDLGPPVNTNANEGAQSITADGKIIYFTACNRKDGVGRCDLYVAKMDGNGKWSDPLNLGDRVNTGFSEKHPAISADGRTLFFTSDRPGGNGGYDLWMTVKTGDSWSTPVNLGDSINTPGTEQSPFIHPDQQSLYFSSDGWPGLGKADVLVARRKPDGSWGIPENLGYPINTNNEEIGFMVNATGDRAYYASSRREGTDTDIFTFEIPLKVRPLPVSYITGRVYDARNMKGLEALFQLIDLETGALVMESGSSPGEGDYFVSLPSGASYAFNVSHPGYLFYSDHFSLEKTFTRLDPFRKDIPLEPIMTGRKIILNNIFFDTDSYQLKDASRVELNKLYDLLVQNPYISIEISGHTDDTGDPDYNQELSLKLAEAVVSYLVNKEIDAKRLKAKGYGETQPVSDNSTEEGRAQNRRTELQVL